MKCSPVEVTTHNMYFHEEASIFTMHSNGRLVATGGGDKDIRLWTVSREDMRSSDFCYTTAVDTSVRIAFHAVLSGHQRGVNCVRFSGDLLASCSDGGEVMVWDGDMPTVVRRLDGDDAYELVWGCGHLFVGFASGNISVFRISVEEEACENSKSMSGCVKPYLVERSARRMSATCVQRIRCHSDVVQGLAFNAQLGLLTSLSKDRTGKTFAFSDRLEQIEHMEHLGKDRLFSTGRGFFRRLSYSLDGRLLYLACCASNSVIVLHYPFRTEHVYGRIGPLDSEPLKIVCGEQHVLVATKKSLYVFAGCELLFCINNVCFMAVTDGCIVDGVCLLSSLDGFLASVRMRDGL